MLSIEEFILYFEKCCCVSLGDSLWFEPATSFFILVAEPVIHFHLQSVLTIFHLKDFYVIRLMYHLLA